MKKLLILFALLACFTYSKSQTVATKMTSSGDTVVNTGTKVTTFYSTEPQKSVTVMLKVVKISGTVAGTVTLQGSLDGVNYETLLPAANLNNASTYTATDVATQVKHFLINNNPYLYYRLSYTGSGTMSAQIFGYVLTRKT